MHVVPGRHDGVRLLPALVVEISPVFLQRCQQCHHLTKDLLIAGREGHKPSLEQRVVTKIHGMHSTTYVVQRIPEAVRHLRSTAVQTH
jgi:hypothetical protein